jgi:hypothetical protein
MKRFVTCVSVLAIVWGTFAAGVYPTLADADASRDIWVKVSPNTIVLGSEKGSNVTVHTDIPFVVVDRSSVALNEITPYLTKADDCGNLVAKFRQGEVEAIVAPPTVMLTLTGLTLDGGSFAGSDSVRVIDDPSPE